jgi:hypothetical protein
MGTIEVMVRKLPFAELFGELKDILTRLKVKGRCSDPAGKLVNKKPLKDVKEATVSFIRKVIDRGTDYRKNAQPV